MAERPWGSVFLDPFDRPWQLPWQPKSSTKGDQRTWLRAIKDCSTVCFDPLREQSAGFSAGTVRVNALEKLCSYAGRCANPRSDAASSTPWIMACAGFTAAFRRDRKRQKAGRVLWQTSFSTDGAVRQTEAVG